MESNIQIISFIFSFAFGILFVFFNEFNNFVVKNIKKSYKLIITILFIVNVVLLYLIFLYKINKGEIHIYFLICVFLGYVITYKKIKVLIKNVKERINVVKKKI